MKKQSLDLLYAKRSHALAARSEFIQALIDTIKEEIVFNEEGEYIFDPEMDLPTIMICDEFGVRNANTFLGFALDSSEKLYIVAGFPDDDWPDYYELDEVDFYSLMEISYFVEENL